MSPPTNRPPAIPPDETTLSDVKQLVAVELRGEGSATTREWFMPNIPAIISLIVAIAALAVVVLK